MSDPEFKIHPTTLLDVALPSSLPGIALQLHAVEWPEHLAGEVHVAGGGPCVAVVIRSRGETRVSFRRPLLRSEEGELVASVTRALDLIERSRIKEQLLAEVDARVAERERAIVLPRGKFSLVFPFAQEVGGGGPVEWYRLVGCFPSRFQRGAAGGALTITADVAGTCEPPEATPPPGPALVPLFVRTRVVLDWRDRILVALRGEFRMTTEADVRLADGKLLDLVSHFTATHDLSPTARRALVALGLAKPLPPVAESAGTPAPEKTS